MRQLERACAECGADAATPALQGFLEQMHRRLLTSEFIENCFNRQKRMKAKDNNRRLELRRAWEVLLEKKVLKSVNRFEDVSCSQRTSFRAERLPVGIQEPVLSEAPPTLMPLSGKKARPEWYSPSASNHAVQFLNQDVCQHLHATG
ncbi:MAG: hypothetical protein ACKPKO_11315, partial [Candidatus Fonsibacter sp.]